MACLKCVFSSDGRYLLHRIRQLKKTQLPLIRTIPHVFPIHCTIHNAGLSSVYNFRAFSSTVQAGSQFSKSIGERNNEADHERKTSDKSEGSNGHLEKHRLGEVVTSKMYLSFTCKVCEGSNSYTISKQAYQSGVVIVKCFTCENHHLIADNLGWFEDIKHKNIEEIMKAKGESVKKFISHDVKEFVVDGPDLKLD